MSCLVDANSHNIQIADRSTFEDLICGKISNSFSTTIVVRLGNLCIASRINTSTSEAANSLLSDRNSVRTGIILGATSGN